MIIVVASGYFDPIHKGHIRYLEASKKLGDVLIVIVNNDTQAILKKGKPFYPNQEERMEIIEALRCVDDVVLSIDGDKSVTKTLEWLKPDIFTNGGDRNSKNIPEIGVCEKYGIQTIFGVGGNKINSSSELTKKL